MNAGRRAFGGWAVWHAAWAAMWALSAAQDAWIGIEGSGSWLRIGAAVVDGLGCYVALRLCARSMRQRVLGVHAWRLAQMEVERVKDAEAELRRDIELWQKGKWREQ